MKKKGMLGALGLGVLVVGLFIAEGIPAVGQQGYSDKIILGETAVVDGSEVSTWARVNEAGQVVWVGLTVPLALVENMPAEGAGPLGAIAVLNYPTVVKETTYFDHAEFHSEPDGHPTNPGYADQNRYGVAHFDFHFYAIPESQVLAIPFGFFFEEAPADRLPRFFAQPEVLSVPQMGRHAAPASEFTATDHWLASMLAGFLPDASEMHFLEEMITRELLLQRKTFTMQVPRPATLGRSTRYPAECVVQYDKGTDSYQIVFAGFQPVQ